MIFTEPARYICAVAPSDVSKNGVRVRIAVTVRPIRDLMTNWARRKAEGPHERRSGAAVSDHEVSAATRRRRGFIPRAYPKRPLHLDSATGK